MPHILIEIGQGLAIIYLMYKQNSHLAEANRIMRERHGMATPEVSSRWKRVGHYWPLMAMGVIAIASWIPYFVSTPQKDVLTNYGGEADANGFRIYSQVDSSELVRHKPDRLMVIARIHNNLISAETDATIARSGTFKITEPSNLYRFFPTSSIRGPSNKRF